MQAIVAVVHEGGEADGGYDACRNPRGPIFDIVRELDPAIDIVLLCAHASRLQLRRRRPGHDSGGFVRKAGVGGRHRNRPRQRRRSFANVRARAMFRCPTEATPINDCAPRIRHWHPIPKSKPSSSTIEQLAAPLAQQPVRPDRVEFRSARSAGGDNALGRLVADAQLAATRTQGAQLAFTNPGGLRADLRASGSDGVVTYADAFESQPFGNTLVTLTLTGAQLKLLLEQQWSASKEAGPERARMLQPSRGFSYAWSANSPHGERIIAESMLLDGRAINSEQRYRVTVNNFLADGGDGFRVLREGTDRVGGPVDVDALTEYLRSVDDAPAGARSSLADHPPLASEARQSGAIIRPPALQGIPMRRTRVSSRSRQSVDAQTLGKLARRLSESGSRLEEQFWQRRLIELINDRLGRRNDDAVEAALEDLARSSQPAYDELADLAESCAESTVIDIDGQPHDTLLLVMPLLAWSRYRLPTTTLSSTVCESLRAHISGHLLARDARIALADYLFSIDQLPEAFADVRRQIEQLGDAVAEGITLHIDSKKLREPVAMLADTRYVLIAIAAPQGAPLYHWQESGVDPDSKIGALTAFSEQVAGALQPVMTGCRFRVLAPNAFHASLRYADRELREFSLEAAVSYLKLAYDFTPNALTAAYGVFEDPSGSSGGEVRIGLAKTSQRRRRHRRRRMAAARRRRRTNDGRSRQGA